MDCIKLSYDLTAEASDDDAIFLETLIQEEKELDLKRVLEDLDNFFVFVVTK